MNIPEYVAFTLERLEQNGFSAYLVGGCVRDFLMNITPHDFDVTTNAKPEQIEKCFSDVKTLDVGKKHGTITLVFDKECVEVTTYRIDGEYLDSRRPESVAFTDKVELDLARRDFTMNAICYSPKKGFVDPFGGKSDIENKRIVCVGEPQVRFSEDALRILRAVRFASRLGFEIEKNTKSAMLEKMSLLSNVAWERKIAELYGIVRGEFAPSVMSELFDVIKLVLTNVELFDKKAFERSCGFSVLTRLCVLYTGISDVKLLSGSLKIAKLDNKTQRAITDVLLSLEENKDKTSDADIKRAAFRMGTDNAVLLYETLYCIDGAKQKYLSARSRLFGFVKEGTCLNLSLLAVNGNDIIQNNIAEPKNVGKILEELLLSVFDGRVENEKEHLLAFAKKKEIKTNAE